MDLTTALNLGQLNQVLILTLAHFNIILQSTSSFSKWPPRFRVFFSCDATALLGPRPPHCRGFEITLRHTTLGRTSLYEWSARRRDVYLTTHNTHKIQTPIHPGGIRTQNPNKRAAADYALDRKATGISRLKLYLYLSSLTMRATCQLIVLDLETEIMFDEEYGLWSPLSCSFINFSANSLVTSAFCSQSPLPT